MADIRSRDEFGNVGIPHQFTQRVEAEREAIFTGDSPDKYSVDYPVEANQDLKALTVVGFNRWGRLVRAVFAPVVEFASGTMTVQVASLAGDSCTIEGVEYTLSAAPAAANDVDIGADDAATAANLASAINADGMEGAYGDGTVPNPTVTATAVGTVVQLRARQPGAQGNAIALGETNNRIDRNAATLTGGFGGVRPIGILPHSIVTAAGENTTAPVYHAGVFNPDRLVWGDSFGTDDQRKRAFFNAPSPVDILIRKIRANTVT